MRIKNRSFISLMLAVLLSLVLATPAMAVPQIPHAFYGTVTVGDGAAPDGVLISAKIGGVEYATTNTLDGKYGYSPTFKVPADDPETPDIEGGVEADTIVFYIEGVEVDSYTFANGEVTELDLEIEELPAPPPPTDGVIIVAPPTYYSETNLFGTAARFRISEEGKILATIEATSADGMLTITIAKGTIALGKDGKRLKSLQAAVDESPPDPPEDAYIIGLAYDFGPDGATFEPAITLAWSYDPDALPEDVAEEDLVVAYYDEDVGTWVEADCVVDTENDTISASVSDFSKYTIIARAAPPLPPEEDEVVPPEEDEVVPPEEEEVAPTEEEEVVTEVPAPTPWPLIGGIIAGVVVVALLIYFLVVRRRTA